MTLLNILRFCRRSSLPHIFWLFAIVLCAGCGSSSATQVAFPTPGPGRTTYTNAKFSYTITYPSDWHLVTESDEAIALVLFTRSVAIPNAIAFQVKGMPNPTGLDAEAWWQQHQPPDGVESAIGPITVSGQIQGFAASGQGQRPYTVYTFTKGAVACQVLVPQVDDANTKIARDVVKTFTWS